MNILLSMPNDSIRSSFFDKNLYSKLNEIGEVSCNETNSNYSPYELKKALENTDIVITGWGHEKITPELAGERLKLVAHTGGSIGPVFDIGLFDEGIKVISGNDLFAQSVAEGVLAYMLCALRKLDYYSSRLKNGNWLGSQLKTESLLNQTVGLISLGTISRYLIELAKPFNIKFKVYSTHPSEAVAKELGIEFVSLEDIFSTCKIVSVHTAANDQTKNMINEKHFKLLQKDSIFINTARGSVIDENALADELEKGRFSAVLDVYCHEPLPKESRLLKFDNITLYPHMAGPAADRRPYITQQILKDIESFTKGEKVEYEITKAMAEKMTQTR